MWAAFEPNIYLDIYSLAIVFLRKNVVSIS